MMTLASAAWSSSRADVFVRRASAPCGGVPLPPSPRPRAAVPRPRAGLLALRPSFATSATPPLLPRRRLRPRRASPCRAASRAHLPPPHAVPSSPPLPSPTSASTPTSSPRRTRSASSSPPTSKSLPSRRVAAGGHHLVASHTGSGKTLTYLLPIVHQLRREEAATGARAKPKRPRVLVIGPTRELAEQVRGVAKAVSHHARFSSELIIGGDKFAAQRQALNRPLDLVVGTPGRIVKHVEKGNMHMSGVTHLVLDEADTLFEAGFGDEIRRLLRPLKKNPEGKQCVVVSATMSEKVIREMREELPDLQIIDTPSLHKSAPNLKHRFIDCPGNVDKMAVVEQIVSGDFRGAKKTMVFCNTMASCQAVEYALQEAELPVVMYNGDMTVEGRQASMKEFVDGDFHEGSAVVMVCTDLAARGLDFGGGAAGKVEHVVNFDFPMKPHRLHPQERTNRARGRHREGDEPRREEGSRPGERNRRRRQARTTPRLRHQQQGGLGGETAKRNAREENGARGGARRRARGRARGANAGAGEARARAKATTTDRRSNRGVRGAARYEERSRERTRGRARGRARRARKTLTRSVEVASGTSIRYCALRRLVCERRRGGGGVAERLALEVGGRLGSSTAARAASASLRNGAC